MLYLSRVATDDGHFALETMKRMLNCYVISNFFYGSKSLAIYSQIKESFEEKYIWTEHERRQKDQLPTIYTNSLDGLSSTFHCPSCLQHFIRTTYLVTQPFPSSERRFPLQSLYSRRTDVA